MAAALIDHLLHHCRIINIPGNSFRMRHHSDVCSQLQGEGATATAPKRRAPRQKELTT
jgi:hypothetical protein